MSLFLQLDSGPFVAQLHLLFLLSELQQTPFRVDAFSCFLHLHTQKHLSTIYYKNKFTHKTLESTKQESIPKKESTQTELIPRTL